MRTLHLLQTLGGVGMSLLLAGGVAWYLLRTETTMSLAPSPGERSPELVDREERCRFHAFWFVKMRWIAAGVTLALVVIGVPVTRILPLRTLPQLLFWCGLLAAANVAFATWARRGRRFERQIAVQAVADLVILTGLLQASGGIENPLYIIYLIHVIIAGILLPKARALAVTVVAGVLFTALALGEYAHLFPHYTNGLFPHHAAAAHGGDAHGDADGQADDAAHAAYDPVFVAGRVLPFLAVLSLVAYLTTLVADRLRASEGSLEAVARRAMLERSRLEGVIHAAGMGMILLGPDLRVQWVSGPIRESLGWDAELGEKCCPMYRAEDGCDDCIASRTFATGRTLEAVRSEPAPGGGMRFMRHATSPVRDADGRVVQVVELVEDITRMKEMEARALHSGKLSVLGTMAAGIAHEIGNPLSSLVTRLHLMERRRDPEFLDESLSHLRNQIERIRRIVHGVSQFARTRQEAWGVWDVNGAVREALAVVKMDRRSRGIEVALSLAEAAPRARGIKDQMVQVFLNLLLNAVEAMPQGGRLGVETFCRNGESGVAISDSGSGMDERTQERLFEPFFTTKAKGTGLGLSICHSLVHAHGGRIEVASEPGRGSRFTVLLPVPEARAASSVGGKAG